VAKDWPKIIYKFGYVAYLKKKHVSSGTFIRTLQIAHHANTTWRDWHWH